jgi:endo-1,4-beta-D-glucanase Y
MKINAIALNICAFVVFSFNIYGQNKPFPQNVTYPYGFKATNITSELVQNEYNRYKNLFLVTCGDYSRPTSDITAKTYAESVGLTMLCVAYEGDKTLYDRLLNFYKSKRRAKANNMMAYSVTCDSTLDQGSVTKADIDVAFSLIIAHKQWGETYLDDAKTIIGILKNSVITTCSGRVVLRIGYSNGGLGGCDLTNISYYTPAFFRVFAQVTSDDVWTTLANDTYTLLQLAANSTTGLVPDWQSSGGTSAAAGYDSNYEYEACRVPWRIALDYLWNGNAEAQKWCTKVSNWAHGIGASNIKDGYYLNGTVIGTTNNSSFVGGFAVGAMCNSQTVVDSFSARLNKLNDAYWLNLNMRIVYLHVLTGNFWKPEDISTSIPFVERNTLRLYPNPASNSITIEGVKNIERFDIIGISGNTLLSKKIHSTDKATLAIDQLSPGAYLLKAIDKTGAVKILKFVK